MRNSHMKFQNPTIHRSKVNGRTHTQTDRQAKSNMPFQLFQSWGHNNSNNKSIDVLDLELKRPLPPPSPPRHGPNPIPYRVPIVQI